MLPLHNIKVIEFCQVAASPFCGMLLADIGADTGDVLEELETLAAHRSQQAGEK